MKTLPHEYPNWSQDELDLLQQSYLVCDNETLQNLFPNRTWNAIILRASKLNLGSRRHNGHARIYSFDFNYFETIDTEEKAYWLGFLYADGSIRKNSLRIGLITEAQEHLEKFAGAIKYDGKVKGPFDVSYVRKGSNKEKRFDLELTHHKFVKDLSKNGVVENKTMRVSWPSLLQNKLNSHFIRGIFDGDGTITTKTTYYKNKTYVTPCFSICGAVPFFLETIVGILASDVGVKPAKVIRRPNTNTFVFSYQGTPALRIRDYLYQNATVWMNRKREKFFSFGYSHLRPRDKEHQQEILNSLVAKRGGKVISLYKGYDEKVTVKCKYGHIWEPRVSGLKRGNWCPKCRAINSAKNVLQKSRESLEKFVLAKNGKLVSEYKGRDISVTIRCEHGKEFTYTSRSILRGAWCKCKIVQKEHER